MNDVTPTLQELLEGHGIATRVESDGWLSTDGAYPACRATTDEPRFRDNGCQLRLDVEVALPQDRLIIESFSAFGDDPTDALHANWHAFCSGTFHVLTSALWGVHDDAHVLVETHLVGDTPWSLYLGNLVRKAGGGVDDPLPDDLMTKFDLEIAGLRLAPGPHWGRLFYANMPGLDNVIEVLLDNQPWEAAESELRSAAWPDLDVFYSCRMFWVMLPH